MFNGHLPAFLASVQVWSRAQSIQQMKRMAHASLGATCSLSQSTPAATSTSTNTAGSTTTVAIAKSDYHASINTQFLLCSFRLNEGVGNCLHSPLTGFIWRGRQLHWHVPPHSLHVNSLQCDRRNGVDKEFTLWHPLASYYVMSNEFELVVVEPHMTTWISAYDGRIIGQG